METLSKSLELGITDYGKIQSLLGSLHASYEF